MFISCKVYFYVVKSASTDISWKWWFLVKTRMEYMSAPRKVSNRKTGISFQSFTFWTNRPLHRSPFDGLPPFHGFFSLWHGPVRENPSTPLVMERLERLKISIITKCEIWGEIWGEDKAPQFCENLQTFVWCGTSLWPPLPPHPPNIQFQTSLKFRAFEVSYISSLVFNKLFFQTWQFY